METGGQDCIIAFIVFTARHAMRASVGQSPACPPYRGHISKTEQDRPIVMKEHCIEVGTADSVVVFQSLSSTVTEIFSVEYWCDLEIWVKGRSRSVKMVPIHRSYTGFILVCHCNYSSILHHSWVIWRSRYHDLEIHVRGHWKSLEMAPFDRSHMTFYSSSIVLVVMVMVVSCTIFEIKRDIGRKTAIFHTPLVFNLHDPLEPLRIFAQNFNTNCPSVRAIRRCKNIAEKCKFLPRVQQRYRQTTDRRQTDGLDVITFGWKHRTTKI